MAETSRRFSVAQPAIKWVLAALALSSGSLVAPAGWGAETEKAVPWVDDLELLRTKGPNPYVSLLPIEDQPDWEYWRTRMAYKAARRAEELGGTAAALVLVTENEAPGVLGENDLPLFAEAVPGFGSRTGEDPTAQILGHLLALPVAAGGPFAEDDGAIPLAHLLSLPAGAAVTAAGIVGDGPHGRAGTASGDFDFYAFTAAAESRIEVAVRTPVPLGALNPVAGLYAGDGTLLAVNDIIPLPGFLSTFDSYLDFTVAESGTYYVVVGGYFPIEFEYQLLPADPFDSASGPGAGSEGTYEVVIAADFRDPGDADFYRVELRPGDVLGANLAGSAGRLSLLGPDDELRVAAVADLSGIYPDASPLLGGGARAALAYVADAAGTYAVGVDRAIGLAAAGDGTYSLELGVARSPSACDAGDTLQILFLDFDGATFDATIVFSPLGTVTLSPLADFLSRWGLTPSDEDAVIDAVIRHVAENLSEDVRLRGLNGDFAASGVYGEFDIAIRNSRDHPEPWGAPNVTRVIVGGTVDELGLRLLGVAESIDPGNFATAETGVVLLDLLSAEANNPNSLNSFPLAPGASKVELVGAGVGNVVSHEAGHLFGNFHTDRDFETGGAANVMDRVDLAGLLVGPGAVFGDADDQDVDFGPDAYSRLEPFAGIEDTLDVIAFDLPRGGGHPDVAVDRYVHEYGALPLATSAAASFVVTNECTLDLLITATLLAGEDAGEFALTAGSGPATLEPGAARTIEAVFTPVTQGAKSATLSVFSNDGDENPLTVSLHGYGGVGDIAIDAVAHEYGDLVYGDAGTDATHTFVLENTDSAAALYVTAMPLTGANPGQFSVAGTRERVLPPSSQVPLTVRFAPGGRVGEMSARLRIVSSDPDESPLDVFLSGRALGPDVAISPGSPYHYGLWPVGQGWWRNFRVTNEGTLDLLATAVTVTGDEDFEITQGGGPFVVTSGETHEVRVEYTAGAVGLRSALLELVTNDPDENPAIVELFGLGGLPELVADQIVHDFGTALLGESVSRTCRIHNVGSITFRGQAELAGLEAEDFSFVQGGGQIVVGPDAEIDVEIRFSPTVAGTRRAMLRLTPDNPVYATFEVALRGSGPSVIPTLSPFGLGLLALAFVLAALYELRRRPSGL